MSAAVWYGPGRENFRLEQVKRPDPGPGEVLIKVNKCFFSTMYVRAILVGHPKLHPPEIFGRMLAGDVVAVGSGVTTVSEGMRVTVNPERPCGECFYCQVEELGHCIHPTRLKPGGMAEFVCVPAPLVGGIFELPSDIKYEEAAYAETLACILQGMDLSHIAFSDTVVIIGDGSVGLVFVQLAQLRGATKIIVAGKHDDSLQQALALGAYRGVNVKVESLRDVVMAETQGYGADVVIEAVGCGETYQEALTLLRCGGRAVGFGGTPPGTTFPGDPNLIHYRSLKIYGSYRYVPNHFRQAIDLIATKQIDLRPIVTHYVPFSKLTTDAVDISQQPNCRGLVIDFAK
ncbi:MAG TPA: theronine dehydrogenase [Cyanobacteria bacterium UBA11149]|nr:theronine dehydrogenase [Cyanobacteria bacterium UBA11367]HBE58901.1 theronine dehydrogenase [Cyanobacteria bacterium UBA11366]HBK65413.1 theronine dehydrogenase [Cyanobacteria bacterium UBA11166]HBR73545.1 theronine dehydrogenase [Cyanobacteria bacterium UBA11159]HBS71774.1 theronine dehydrogenase [Cyanobacteria bacterium UBA11153]HBW92225.1 theronine dehydrogenase [Cyanobacteria bacterium UBA11149]HCA93972.1 theronine dehydrogenase [Cyanobacteria bacterium UBA9226]